jgi:hypothetical protein
VAYKGPLTFKRAGPRDTPHEIKLSVSIISVVGRNGQPPDWHPVDLPNAIKRPIARRILDIEANNSGSANGPMLFECNQHDM